MYYYLFSEGTKWHQRRKILTTAFHFNILNEFVDTFNYQAQQMVATLKKSDESVHNLTPLLSKFTLDTICGKSFIIFFIFLVFYWNIFCILKLETAMGTRLRDEYESQQFRWAVHEMGELICLR